MDDQGTLRLTHEVVGRTRYGVTPLHRVGDFDDHRGFFHTHPLRSDASEQVGFSDTDFAGMIEDGCSISLVQNGKTVYALVRTASTPSGPVTSADEATFLRVFLDCMSRFDGGAEAEKRANIALSSCLGLAFYAGPAGEPLKRLYPQEPPR